MRYTPFMKPESNLGGLLGKSSRLMANLFNSDLIALGLTISQWTLLALLWERDHQHQKELQHALLKDKATVTSLVTYLIRNGFITKTKDENDKRSYIVSLTQKGQEVRVKTIPFAIQNITLATKGIDKEALEITTKVLSQIITNLTQENL